MAALPLGKLAILAVKQISKPLARIVRTQAKEIPLLQRMVAPIGQGWHFAQIRLQRLTLNSKRKDVRPLSDAGAVELGAELLGEFFIYGVAATLAVTEYQRSADKNAAKEEQLQCVLRDVSARLAALEQRVEATQAQHAGLAATVAELPLDAKELKRRQDKAAARAKAEAAAKAREAQENALEAAAKAEAEEKAREAAAKAVADAKARAEAAATP